MQAVNKIHVANSTTLSLNDRFTIMQNTVGNGGGGGGNNNNNSNNNGGIGGGVFMNIPRRSRSRSRSRPIANNRGVNINYNNNNNNQMMNVNNNRKIIDYLEQKHTLQAALRLKRRSMKVNLPARQRLTQRTKNWMTLKRNRLPNTLNVLPNGKLRRTNSKRNLSTMRADMMDLMVRDAGLFQSNQRQPKYNKNIPLSDRLGNRSVMVPRGRSLQRQRSRSRPNLARSISRTNLMRSNSRLNLSARSNSRLNLAARSNSRGNLLQRTNSQTNLRRMNSQLNLIKSRLLKNAMIRPRIGQRKKFQQQQQGGGRPIIQRQRNRSLGRNNNNINNNNKNGNNTNIRRRGLSVNSRLGINRTNNPIQARGRINVRRNSRAGGANALQQRRQSRSRTRNTNQNRMRSLSRNNNFRNNNNNNNNNKNSVQRNGARGGISAGNTQMRGRSRSRNRGRNVNAQARSRSRGRTAGNQLPSKSKEQLDKELEQYMASSKSNLDQDLDMYMGA